MPDLPTKVATLAAVMWSAAQIAERDGVTREAVLKQARDLAAQHDLAVERDGRGRIATINVAQYDHLRGRYGDPSKVQTRPSGQASTPADNHSYDEALRQRTWLETEKRRFEVAEIRGTLVRRDRMQDAALAIAQDIVLALDRLPGAADDLATAVARDGTHGLRVALKRLSAEIRGEMAAALAALAAAAPLTDQPLAGPDPDPP